MGLRASRGTYAPRSTSDGGTARRCLQKGIAKAAKDSLHYQMTFVGFQGHSYIRELLNPDSVVLDLGANKGSFAREIHEAIGCRVTCVEANPKLAAALDGKDWLVVRNLAVCGRSGELTFHVSTNLEASSIGRLVGFEYESEITVPAITLEQIIDSLGRERINVLKCDIEGAEIEAFAACPDKTLLRLDQINIEFHHWAGMGTTEEFVALKRRLADLGFYIINFNTKTDWDVLFVNSAKISRLAFEWTRLRHWLGNRWSRVLFHLNLNR